MVNFINTAPVYIPWQEYGGHDAWEVVEGAPTELNSMLRRGMIDAGLISSYAYALDYQRYVLLPDLCISASGAVGSVLLFSRLPLEQLGGSLVGLTFQSATSINLLRIILEKFSGIAPQYRIGSFGEMEQDELVAYLAIGDEALRLRSRNTGFFQYDLAEIWLEHTGMPFVFAVCAVRIDAWQARKQHVLSLGERLLQCRNIGKQDLDHISSLVAGRIPMDEAECLEYLKGIELDLSPVKQKGLLLFFNMLYELGDFPLVSSLGMAY